MTIETLRAFFMWCSILNVGFLLVASMIGMFRPDFVYRLHSRFFPIPRESFNVCMYAFIGLWKILVIVFNVIPYVALVIVGKR